MALILKQEANANVTTPPAGSGAVFLNTADQLTVKDTAGNISTIPTFTPSGNTSVFFNDAGAFGQSANFTFVKTTNTLTVSGNVAATGVLTDNLYYANGSPWDLSDPGGSNTQIQFNDEESFGGSAAFTFNKSTNLVSMGGALSVTGNANVGNIGAAAGVFTANVTAANVSGGNVVSANYLTGTLTTASQPNITSVGSLTNLNVSGNAIISGNLTVDGNVTYVNVDSLAVEDPVISLGGGPNGNALTSNDGKDRGTLLNYFTSAPVYAFMGWDNSNGEFGFGSNVSIVNDVVTFTNLGNIRASTVIANVSATTVAGSLTTAAQPNITSVGTLTSASVTGNVTAGNVYANSGTVGASLLTGTLTTAAQPNVTSVGTLSALSVTANVTAGGVKTDNLYYANGSPWDLQQPAGSNTAIQFNDNDSFGGSSAFTFDKSSNVVTASGNVNANNFNAGNTVTAGNIYANSGTVGASLLTGTLTTAAQPNVTSVGTLSSLTVTGNIGGGNINTSGVVSASGNVIGGNITTNGLISATGNVSGGNLNTAGALSVTGNANVGNIGANNAVFTNVSGNGAALAAITGANVTGAVAYATTANSVAGANVSGEVAYAATANSVAGANVSGQVANALVAGTVYTAAQPNITSVGTLTAANVTGNVIAGNIYANIGTIGAQTLKGEGGNISNIQGANVSGTVATATTAGTVTTNAQPNITSVGTLTSLTATGNISGGNVTTGGVLSAVGNVSGGNVNTGGIVSATGNVSGGNLTTAGVVAATGNVSGGNLTTGGALSVTGNANVGNIGAAAGVFTANVTAANVSGGNVVSANYLTGTLTTAAQPNITSVGSLTNLNVSGNAVITGNLTVDGNVTYVNVDTLAVEDPVISLGGGPNGAPLSSNDGKDRGTLLNYFTTAPVYAFMGWDNGNSEFAFGSNVGIVNDVISYNALGNVRVGNIIGNGQALTGLTGANVTGQVANALVAGTVYTAAQPNITSVGTLTSLSVTGNANVGNIGATNGVFTNVSGNGSALSSITGGNVTGQVGNALVAGTVYTAAQPNITSVGTLTSLSVTGNANVGNIGATNGVFTNVSGNGANLSSITGGNVTGQVGNALVAGTVYTAAQPNITSVGTLTSLAVTGNASAGNLNTAGKVVASTLESNVATGTAPFVVASTTKVANLNADLLDGFNTDTGANANTVVIRDANGSFSANVVTATLSGAATTAGTVTTAAQPNITSVGTLTGLGVNGNITAANITANTGVFTGNGSGLSAIAGANVTGQVANAAVAGTVYTAAQPNITSVGTLTSVAVTGNATAGNVYANSGTIGASLLTGTLTTAAQPNITSVGTLTSAAVTGNVTAGNVYANSGTIGAQTLKGEGGNISNIQGANVSGAVASATSATTAGTVTTAAQPNITSVGTLSSLSVTANVAAGNLTTTGVLTVTGTGVSSIAGNLDMTSNTIINLANPTNDQDAATKSYVDSVAQGLDPKNSVTLATNAALPAYTYNNGSSGVGATLTGTANGALSIDGTAVTATNRVLIKNEGVSNSSPYNGIYTVTTVGNATAAYVLTRSTDFDIWSEVPGGYTFVESGSVNADTSWVCTSDATGTMGTTNIVFAQFSGPGTYAAGTGLTLTGTVFSITNTAVTPATYGNGDRVATFTVNAQGQLTAASNVAIAANAANLTGTTLNSSIVNSSLTSVGTLGSLSVTGNVSAGNVSGTLLTGTLTTAAQPNITSVGTLTSASVTGNVTAGNVYANSGTIGAATLKGEGGNISNIQGANVSGAVASATAATNASALLQNTSTATTVYPTFSTSSANGNSSAVINTGISANLGNASITATTFVGALSGAATTAGTVTTAAQPNITSVGTLTSLGVNGTVTAVNLTANTGVITGNGNGISSIVGANVTGQVGNALVAGTVYTAAQPNITSVGTLTSLAVTGNASAGNLNTAGAVVASTLTSNVATGTAPLTVTSTTRVANLNVAYANVADNINVAAGTGNNFLIFANAATGNVAEVTSTGLTANLSNNSITATTFVGALSGAATTAGTVTTAAQPNITSVGTLTSLGVNGTVTAVAFTANTGVFTGNGSGLSAIAGANVTGTVSSATTAGTVTTAAQPNITSVGTLTSLAVTGNITGGNLIGPHANGNSNINMPAANGNVNITVAGTANVAVITATGVNVAGTLNATGNANVGNIGATNGVFTNVSGNGSALTAITGGNVTGQVGNALVAGTVYTAAQPNITSVGTLTSLAVTGNITGGNLIGPHANGNSNVNIPAAAGNVNISVNGTANVAVVTATGVNVAGTFNATGAGTIGGDLSVTGNAVVTGNLAINGNLTYLNVETIAVEDPIINLQTGANGAAPVANSGKDVGSALNYYDTAARVAFMGWDVSNAEFGMASVASISAEVVTFSTYGNLRVGNIIGNGQALTGLNASNISSGTLAQARLANSSLTVNGTSISLGGSATITANTTQTLTLGTYLTGTSFNGGTAVTATVDATSANTASKVVARDASGNFSAGTITATLSGAATTAGTVTTAAQPNITSVGTLTGLTLANAAVISVGSNTNVGTFTGNFSLSAGSRLNATYADLAEKYVADATYEPGTVLEFGGEFEVTLADAFDSTRVAGVVTTNPAYTMNNECEGEHVATIALQGRVPVKVSGNIAKGDLLVSASNGHAVANNEARAGTIIGKSLENFNGETGVIEVAVGRF